MPLIIKKIFTYLNDKTSELSQVNIQFSTFGNDFVLKKGAKLGLTKV